MCVFCAFLCGGKILKWFTFDFAICALTVYTRCLGESMKLPGPGVCSRRGLSFVPQCWGTELRTVCILNMHFSH